MFFIGLVFSNYLILVINNIFTFCQRMKWLDGINSAMDMTLGKLQEMVRDMVTWHDVVHGVTKIQT